MESMYTSREELVEMLKEKYGIKNNWDHIIYNQVTVDKDSLDNVFTHLYGIAFTRGMATNAVDAPPSMEPTDSRSTSHCNIDQEVSGMPNLSVNPLGWA